MRASVIFLLFHPVNQHLVAIKNFYHMQIRRVQPGIPVSIETLEYQIKVPDNKPHNILEEIVWQKEREVARWREKTPLNLLREQVAAIAPPVRNFLTALRNSSRQPALIAEVKKASPSKGVIREDFDPVSIAQSYVQGGAVCLSVLTDEKFFQGGFENLTLVRSVVDLPLLCKEFIIYPYQIYLGRKHGADAVLLIAAILPDSNLRYFLKIIKALGMTALVEVHSAEELERVLQLENVELVGINNRNLMDFSVSLQTTSDLLKKYGAALAKRDILVVSESGIRQPVDLETVRVAGAAAVLIGESLVKQPDPAQAIAELFA
jgi:indole-3-glycerol phosphate synthase